MVMPVASNRKSMRNHHSWAMPKVQYSRVPHTSVTDITFTRSGIALFSLKLRIYVPSLGWFMSHSYSRGELRKYNAAESNRNGVVGSMGTKIPMMPSASDRLPKNAKIYFINIGVMRGKRWRNY